MEGKGKGNTNPFIIERMSKETESGTVTGTATATATGTKTPELPVSGYHHMINDEDEAFIMESFSSKRRCCSLFPCFGSQPSPTRSSSIGGSASSPSMWEKLQQTAEIESRWWAGPIKGLKKIREWSEIIAGPKWKTFIRRFNRSGKGAAAGKFQYDPWSYALNFDDGPGHNGNLGEDGYFPDFSSRYASLPNSCKSSIDLGKNGLPP